MRRALLLVLLAGGLAGLGAAAGPGNASWRDPGATTTALGRAEATDVPAPSALTRGRERLEREHGTRGVIVVFSVAAALALAGAWWLRRARSGRLAWTFDVAGPRTRAPPVMTDIVPS